jgi:hypothetical protein
MQTTTKLRTKTLSENMVIAATDIDLGAREQYDWRNKAIIDSEVNTATDSTTCKVQNL